MDRNHQLIETSTGKKGQLLKTSTGKKGQLLKILTIENINC
jgi:hypothetical protein